MKKIISLLISVCIVLSVVPTFVSAAAAGTTFTAGNFTYKVNTDTTTVTLTSIAATKLTGAVTVPATVSDGTTTYTVTHLGNAFKANNSNNIAEGTKEAVVAEMTSLVLPDTMTNFTGTATFYGCKGLTSIHLPKNFVKDGSSGYGNCLYNTFNYCTKLTSVTLPAGVTACFGTFQNSGVKNVTITGTNAVTFYCNSGDSKALAWNANTTGITIYYPAGGTGPNRYSGNGINPTVVPLASTFTSGNFTYSVNGDGATVTLTAIAEGVNLSGAVTVPETVTSGKTYTVTQIGDAFKDKGTKTAEMTSLVLPDTITKFTGTATFYACSGLTSIQLPKNLITDGSTGYGNCLYNTFQWCTKLTEVTLPASIVNCFGTFQNSGVKTVTITGTNAVGFYCDSGDSKARAWNANTTGITIYYPENGTAPTRITGNNIGITAIKQGSEPETPVLSTFELGDFVYKIIEDTDTVGVTGFSSTSDKSGAKTLPSKVTYGDKEYTVVSVGYAAFANQTNLTSFVMADTVTTVGQNLFYGCKNLTYVHLSDSLTNAGASYQLIGTFYGCTNLKSVTIPSGIKCLPKTFLNSGIEHIVLKSKGTEIPKGGSNEYVPVSNPETVNIYYPADGSVYGGYSTYIKNYFIYDGAIAYKQKDDGTLMVVSILPENELTGAVTIPSTIGALKVTEIGAKAFENADDITSVTIPDSITVIGERAFADCDKLESVAFSKNIQGELKGTFAGCTKLSSVIIPEGVTTLNGTFEGCQALENVKIAQSVTTLSNKAFYGCTALTELVVADTVTQITDGENGDGTVFPSGITLIVQEDSAALSYAITNDINYIVKSVVEYSVKNGNAEVTKANFRIVGEYEIPEEVVIGGTTYTVTSIAAKAFEGQDALTIISLPDAISEISEDAFDGCTNVDFAVRVNSETTAYEAIKGVNANYIVDDVNSGLAYKKYATKSGLEVYCAANDTQLTGEIEISAFDGMDVVSIGENAFRGQTGITSVEMADTITSIGAYAFAECSSLVSATLSANTEGTLDSTFVGCESLENVDIPEGVTALKNTYNGCTSLTRVIIPENVTAIYANTFAYCEGLETVVIPDSVTTFDRIIGFKDESQLEAEYVETNTSKKWVDNPFKGATNENLAICGERGSAAEEFAYSSGIKFIDVANGDYHFEYSSVEDKTINVSVRDIYGNGDVSVICALYGDDNLLLNCVCEDATFDNGEVGSVFEKDVTLPKYTDGTTVKLYVWNNMTELDPIMDNITVKENRPIKILVLGNSISTHGTSASSGWFAPDSQGMAATSLDKDFVHVMLAKAQEVNPNVEVKIVSVWSLEANFHNLESLIVSEYQEAVNYDADIIIAQFGENVKNNENEGSLGGSFDNDNEFTADTFANIVKAFMSEGKDVPVIAVTSMMNNKAVVLDAKSQACEDNGWAYVNLCNDKNFAESKNAAYYLTPNQVKIGLENGTFKEDVAIASGVYVHPGNNGMRAMAYGIWRYLEPIVEEMTYNN